MSLTEQNQSPSALERTYPAVNHLMLLFQEFGPRDVAEALRAQLDKLAATVPDTVRKQDDEWRAKWINPPPRTDDREKSIFDQIDHAKTSSQRDQLYLKLALITAEKGDLRARDFSDKIDESELRKTSRAYVDADLAIWAIERKEAERALELVRTGELSHIQKVWVLTQASKLLAKADRDKSHDVLDSATAEARRIDGSDPDRPRALMAVANGFWATDRERAWDTVFDAVKAANSADGFIGEDGQLTISISTRGMTSLRNLSAPDFDVGGIFGKLANADYDRAIQIASAFKGEEPRASAVIAIARAVLDSRESPSGAGIRATKDSK